MQRSIFLSFFAPVAFVRLSEFGCTGFLRGKSRLASSSCASADMPGCAALFISFSFRVLPKPPTHPRLSFRPRVSGLML